MRLSTLTAAFATLATASMSFAAAPTATVQSNNEVGFKLMQEALKNEQAPKNILVSPISAHYALSMALNGTAASTRKSFLEALSYETSSTVESINAENADLLKKLSVKPLTDAQKAALEPWEKLPPVVSIQNSLWSTNGATDGRKYTYKRSFVDALKANYATGAAKSLDFKDAKSADVINQWTSDNTNKMIPTIIDADALKNLLWVLLNTTYLEAQWQTPFGKPFDADFTNLDGVKSQVKTMSRHGNARFATTADYQVAEIAIAQSKMRAFVILPKQASQFEALQKDGTNGIWTQAAWTEIFANLKSVSGTLTMPKFTFEYGVEMKEDQPVTKGLGLNFLFKNSANFAEMDGPGSIPSKVGIIKQNTKIEFDENGVKAAAATLVGGVARAGLPRFDIQMIVDRPFYVAIQDEATGAFLFLGQVIEPK